MIQQTPQAEKFKQQMCESLQHETLNPRAVKIGRHANVDPRSIRIELKISHEELSEMVGTTRPRISVFM
jgi:hypothetical protein